MPHRTHRRRRRLAQALVVAVAVLVGVGACSAGDAEPESGVTTITWYAGSIDQDQNDYRVALVDEFQNAHPSIKVELFPGPTNTDDGREVVRRLIQDSQAGEPTPDVYLGDVIWPAEFAAAGLALRLDGEFAPDFWEKFAPELLPATRYGGKTYAAPLFTDQGLLYYRTDLVSSGPPATWEELVAEAERVRREHPDLHGYVWQGDAYEGLTCAWTEVLADADGQTLDDAGTTSMLTAPDPGPALRALEFLENLVARGVTPREVVDYQEPDATTLFVTGQAVFLRGWNSAYARIVTSANEAVQGNVGVAPLPYFADKGGPGYSASGGWNLFVNPHTRELDAVKTFIEWMTDAQAQRILARYYQLPANAAVRDDPDIRDNDAMSAALDARAVSRPSYVAAYPAVSEAVYSAVNSVLREPKSPQDALREAHEKINAAL